MVSRRGLIGAAATAALAGAAGTATSALPVSELKPITGDARPIQAEERLARLAKAQRLMREQGIGAILLEPGAAMDYFTGVLWRRSERTTAALIPANGEVVIITPHFEEPSVRETLGVPGEIRIWHEHESPFLRIRQALEDRGVRSGKVGVEFHRPFLHRRRPEGRLERRLSTSYRPTRSPAPAASSSPPPRSP